MARALQPSIPTYSAFHLPRVYWLLHIAESPARPLASMLHCQHSTCASCALCVRVAQMGVAQRRNILFNQPAY
eukprot:scaffold3715_cov37-Tisochrysis_lutea.AAC.3